VAAIDLLSFVCLVWSSTYALC